MVMEMGDEGLIECRGYRASDRRGEKGIGNTQCFAG